MTEQIEGGFDRDGVGLDLQQLISRLELLVDAARRFDERKDEAVVPSLEVEVGLRDDDQETVYTELVRFTPKVDVGAEDGALPGGSRQNEPIGTTLDEVLREFAEALEVDGPAESERPDDRIN